MTQVMCIAPSTWWSEIDQAPCAGPVFGETCSVLEEVTNGYVLQGYGEEPYYAGWFVRWSEAEVGVEEEIVYA